MFRPFEATTADQVWQKAANAFREGVGVVEQSSRAGPTKEILHAAFTVREPTQRWVTSRQPPLNVAFAIAEVVWIVTGRKDLAFLQAWNRRLPKYVGSGPSLHGAYGFRLRRHFGVDQLVRVYEVLKCNPDSRQAVLQIWDPRIDLPHPDGSPEDMDIPCNVFSILKLRQGKLEWLQIMRSNDLFLGTPHNFVQFTSLQEIVAGWLGVDCGPYHQVCDSLHLYECDEAKVLGSPQQADLPLNSDSLALPKEASDTAFGEIGRRVDLMVLPGLQRDQLRRISTWSKGPAAFRNMLAILAAEAARRRGWPDLCPGFLDECTNPLYEELWRRWVARVGK